MSRTNSLVEVLTPPGRGAVAVVRCRADSDVLDAAGAGPAVCVTRDGRPLADQPVNRIVLARWGHEHPEDVVFCRTGPSEFEIHCHGGTAAVARVKSDLETVLGPRAGSAVDELEALLDDAWQALARATTLRTADLLLHQAAVAWPEFLKRVQTEEPPDVLRIAQEALHWSEFGRRLTERWTVALCGAPNAGKSSLMNVLAGFERSIVHPTPGTTRDAVTMDVAFDGWPIRLIDTAGLRESADVVETAGIDRARQVMREADLVVQVYDATQDPPEPLAGALIVANKIDLIGGPTPLASDVRTSAVTGDGLGPLIQRIVARLIDATPPDGVPIPVSIPQRRFLERLSTG